MMEVSKNKINLLTKFMTFRFRTQISPYQETLMLKRSEALTQSATRILKTPLLHRQRGTKPLNHLLKLQLLHRRLSKRIKKLKVLQLQNSKHPAA